MCPQKQGRLGTLIRSSIWIFWICCMRYNDVHEVHELRKLHYMHDFHEFCEFQETPEFCNLHELYKTCYKIDKVHVKPEF